MHFKQTVKRFFVELIKDDEPIKHPKHFEVFKSAIVFIISAFIMEIGIISFGNDRWLPTRIAERTEVWRADLHYHLPNITPNSWENPSLISRCHGTKLTTTE